MGRKGGLSRRMTEMVVVAALILSLGYWEQAAADYLSCVNWCFLDCFYPDPEGCMDFCIDYCLKHDPPASNTHDRTTLVRSIRQCRKFIPDVHKVQACVKNCDKSSSSSNSSSSTPVP